MTTPLARKIEATAAAVEELEQRVRNELWLDLALESAEFGAWFWNLADGNRAIVRNDQYNRLFNIDANATWTLEAFLSAIHPGDVNQVRERVQAVIAGRLHRYDVQYRILGSDGIVHWLHSEGKHHRDSAGAVIGVAGVVRDVSRQVRFQEERSRFLATLSHDLRNPLAAAKASADLVRRYPDRAEGRGPLLERVIRNIDRADGMIQDLLDMSRLQAGESVRGIIEEGDLETLLQDSVADLRARFGDRFRASSSGSPLGNWPLRALRRVIENLATNAVKYGDAAAPILIQLQRGSEGVSLSVHNEGNPISPEDQKSLFHPYRQAAGARTSGDPGWGLGLYLVRGIAGGLGGQVTVQSDPRSGTTFRMTFPIPSASSAGKPS